VTVVDCMTVETGVMDMYTEVVEAPMTVTMVEDMTVDVVTAGWSSRMATLAVAATAERAFAAAVKWTEIVSHERACQQVLNSRS